MLDEPFRMRGAGFERQGVHQGEQFGGFTAGAAQDGVDEAAGAPGGGHGFVHGGVFGDLEDQNLAKADAQAPAAAVVEVLVFGEHGDPVVQQGEIPQGGEDDVAQEGGVRQAELAVALDVVHEIGGKAPAPGPLAEDIQRHAADGGGGLAGTAGGMSRSARCRAQAALSSLAGGLIDKLPAPAFIPAPPFSHRPTTTHLWISLPKISPKSPLP